MDYLSEAEKKCRLNATYDVPEGLTSWCPLAWDGLLCWPVTPGGELVSLACPEYYRDFDPQLSADIATCRAMLESSTQEMSRQQEQITSLISENTLLKTKLRDMELKQDEQEQYSRRNTVEKRATRKCMEDGRWYWSEESNGTWTNYTQCFSKKSPFVFPTPSSLISSYLPIVKAVSQIGYSVSLITLIVAFCILATFKGLRCPRNKLHMHLFLSFMLRACTTLFKDLVNDSLSRLVISETSVSETIIIHQQTEDWTTCRAVTGLWQYFLLANYCWILMEGLYLHNLIFLALFTDSSSIALYIVLGWGLPAIFVVPWIFVRAAWENTLCWTTNSNPYYLLLIRGPTTVSIFINFCLFINIVRVLLSKLQASICEENKKFRKWAKSTLVLVPLFGVHYAIFLGMSYVEGSERLEIAWLFGDQLFASFQGFFVAVLYCFLNGEVRTEISKKWRRWWRSRGGKSGRHNANYFENNAYPGCSTVRGCCNALFPQNKLGFNTREGDYSKRESGLGAESCVTSTVVTFPNTERASYYNNSIADPVNRSAQNNGNRKILAQSSDIELHSFPNFK